MLAVQVDVGLLKYPVLHVHEILGRVDALYELGRALLEGGYPQHLLLVVFGYGQACAQEVYHEEVIRNVHHGKLGLVGQVLTCLDETDGTLATRICKYAELCVLCLREVFL